MLWKLFGRTHGRTDTRMDGQGKHYIPPTSLKRGYKYENTLDIKDFKFPMPLTDIPNFEKKNNLSINVYGLTRENKVQVLKL